MPFYFPIRGSNHSDWLPGSELSERIVGLAGDDTLDGQSGDDLLLGGEGNDLLLGGDGFDLADYRLSAAAITVDLALGRVFGEGNDSLQGVEGLIASTLADTLNGSSGRDSLAGMAGDDLLSGLAGDDHLDGGSGNDTLDGGEGFDTAVFQYAPASVFASLQSGSASFAGGETLFINCEALSGSHFADTLVGDDGNNALSGRQGNDTLSGGLGNDSLTGGAGSDFLDGGEGIDAIDLRANPHQVYVNLLQNQAMTNLGFDDFDTLSNIENIHGSRFSDNLSGDLGANEIWGGNGDDFIRGDWSGGLVLFAGGNDTLYGGIGDDDLEGGGGDDLLLGGVGNDYLTASPGNDTLDGGAGYDIASFWFIEQRMIVNLANHTLQIGDFSYSLRSIEGLHSGWGNDRLIGTYRDDLIDGGGGNDRLIGGRGNDGLDGGGGNDYLLGQAGNDRLAGGDGRDTLEGGYGDDLYVISDGNDVVIETADGDVDTVISSVPYLVLAENVENARFVYDSWEAGTIIGNSLDNLLVAGMGENILYGKEGSDTVSYENSPGGVQVDLSRPGPQPFFVDDMGYAAASSGDVLISIENLIGSSSQDTLSGDGNDNRIAGSYGQDILRGNGGSDSFVFSDFGELGWSVGQEDIIEDFASDDRIDLSAMNLKLPFDKMFTELLPAGQEFTAPGQLRFENQSLLFNHDDTPEPEASIQLTGVTALTLAQLVLW